MYIMHLFCNCLVTEKGEKKMESGGIIFISSLTSESGGEQRGKEGSGALP